jgi:predicted membrane channel-forming protein YqfA (hemolysin III family)
MKFGIDWVRWIMLKDFSAIYAMILAFLIAIIIGGKVTHQGFVLGMVSIVTGLLLIYRSWRAPKRSVLVNTVIFVAIELTACVVDFIGNDPTELWFASLYAIYSTVLICEILALRYLNRNPRQ